MYTATLVYVAFGGLVCQGRSLFPQVQNGQDLDSAAEAKHKSTTHRESDFLEHARLKALSLLLLQDRLAAFTMSASRSALSKFGNSQSVLNVPNPHMPELRHKSFGRSARCSHMSRSAGTEFPPASYYKWRGYSCSFFKAGGGPPILLLHGFAGSAYSCWRSNLCELAKTNTVYALDLLGFGASAQPANVVYGIDLWRDQCEDFISEQMTESPVVIGHASGSLLALELAKKRQGLPVRAVGMMSCTIGMNPLPKNSLKVEAWRRNRQAQGIDVGTTVPLWQLPIASAVFAFYDIALNQRWLLLKILERFSVEGVRGGLQNSYYANPERVTDDLVRNYLSLVQNKEAAAEVFRQILTNPDGPLPFAAAQTLSDEFPLLIIWGKSDKVSKVSSTVGEFFRARSQQLAATRFEEVDSGHVPQDDVPDVANRILREWLATI